MTLQYDYIITNGSNKPKKDLSKKVEKENTQVLGAGCGGLQLGTYSRADCREVYESENRESVQPTTHTRDFKEDERGVIIL